MAKLTCRKQLAVNCKKLKTDNKGLVQKVQLKIKEVEGNKIRHMEEISRLQLQLKIQKANSEAMTERFQNALKASKKWYQIIIKV